MLQFQNGRLITGRNYKTLDAVGLKQMAICARNGFGKEFTTPEHFLEQCGDGEFEEGEAELWDVTDSENPEKILYNAWIYLADTGNVFDAGTDKDTGVGMIQFDFVDLKTNKNTALSDAIQEAFDNHPEIEREG
jgi:hypothetical protein